MKRLICIKKRWVAGAAAFMVWCGPTLTGGSVWAKSVATEHDRIIQESAVVAENGRMIQKSAVVAEHDRIIQESADAVEDDRAPQIALTFDDGPHPVYTEQILDGLKERGVTATFFVLGENIAGNEAILERMHEEGHLIGNHTYSHVKLNCMDHQCAVEEIQETSMLVEQITGEGTEYVRPPFGIWSKELEYDVLMLPVLWTIDTLDWTTKNVPVTVQKVLNQAEDQSIILFHDCYASSAEAALRAVDALLEQGYEFVTVDRIILAP